ncbi:MAG: hypothetical protein WC592_07990 [Candidatus Omnitrophota bacterium]
MKDRFGKDIDTVALPVDFAAAFNSADRRTQIFWLTKRFIDRVEALERSTSAVEPGAAPQGPLRKSESPARIDGTPERSGGPDMASFDPAQDAIPSGSRGMAKERDEKELPSVKEADETSHDAMDDWNRAEYFKSELVRVASVYLIDNIPEAVRTSDWDDLIHPIRNSMHVVVEVFFNAKRRKKAGKDYSPQLDIEIRHIWKTEYALDELFAITDIAKIKSWSREVIANKRLEGTYAWSLANFVIAGHYENPKFQQAIRDFRREFGRIRSELLPVLERLRRSADTSDNGPILSVNGASLKGDTLSSAAPQGPQATVARSQEPRRKSESSDMAEEDEGGNARSETGVAPKGSSPDSPGSWTAEQEEIVSSRLHEDFFNIAVELIRITLPDEMKGRVMPEDIGKILGDEDHPLNMEVRWPFWSFYRNGSRFEEFVDYLKKSGATANDIDKLGQRYNELLAAYRRIIQWALEGRLKESSSVKDATLTLNLYRGAYRQKQYERSFQREGCVYATESKTIALMFTLKAFELGDAPMDTVLLYENIPINAINGYWRLYPEMIGRPKDQWEYNIDLSLREESDVKECRFEELPDNSWDFSLSSTTPPEPVTSPAIAVGPAAGPRRTGGSPHMASFDEAQDAIPSDSRGMAAEDDNAAQQGRDSGSPQGSSPGTYVYPSLDVIDSFFHRNYIDKGIYFEQHDFEQSKKIVDEILKRGMQKIMVVGDSLQVLPIYLALLGRDVIYVEENSGGATLREGIYGDVIDDIRKEGFNNIYLLKVITSEIGSLDLEAQGLEAGSFDLVTLIDLGCNPVGDPAQWFTKTKELLKSQGYIVTDETDWTVHEATESLVSQKPAPTPGLAMTAFSKVFPSAERVMADRIIGTYSWMTGVSNNVMYKIFGDDKGRTTPAPATGPRRVKTDPNMASFDEAQDAIPSDSRGMAKEEQGAGPISDLKASLDIDIISSAPDAAKGKEGERPPQPVISREVLYSTVREFLKYMNTALSEIRGLLDDLSKEQSNQQARIAIINKLRNMNTIIVTSIFQKFHNTKYKWLGYAAGNKIAVMINRLGLPAMDVKRLQATFERLGGFVNALSLIVDSGKLEELERYKRTEYMLDVSELRSDVISMPQGPDRKTESPDMASFDPAQDAIPSDSRGMAKAKDEDGMASHELSPNSGSLYNVSLKKLTDDVWYVVGPKGDYYYRTEIVPSQGSAVIIELCLYQESVGGYSFSLTENKLGMINVFTDFRGTGAADVLLEDICQRVFKGDRNHKFKADITRHDSPRAAIGEFYGNIDEYRKAVGMLSEVTLSLSSISATAASQEPRRKGQSPNMASFDEAQDAIPSDSRGMAAEDEGAGVSPSGMAPSAAPSADREPKEWQELSLRERARRRIANLYMEIYKKLGWVNIDEEDKTIHMHESTEVRYGKFERTFPEAVDELVQFAGIRDGTRVCDFGSGDGWTDYRIATYGAVVDGIEEDDFLFQLSSRIRKRLMAAVNSRFDGVLSAETAGEMTRVINSVNFEKTDGFSGDIKYSDYDVVYLYYPEPLNGEEFNRRLNSVMSDPGNGLGEDAVFIVLRQAGYNPIPLNGLELVDFREVAIKSVLHVDKSVLYKYRRKAKKEGSEIIPTGLTATPAEAGASPKGDTLSSAAPKNRAEALGKFRVGATALRNALGDTVAQSAEMSVSPNKNVLILYADSILQQGGAVDVEETVRKATMLSGATLIIYGRLGGYADILEDMIKSANPTVKIVKIGTTAEFVSRTGIGYDKLADEAGELECVVNFAKRQGIVNGTNTFLGVIKGKTDDAWIDGIRQFAGEKRIPVVLYAGEGVYPFSAALKAVINIANDDSPKKKWFNELPPIERRSSEIDNAYEDYRRSLEAAVSA